MIVLKRIFLALAVGLLSSFSAAYAQTQEEEAQLSEYEEMIMRMLPTTCSFPQAARFNFQGAVIVSIDQAGPRFTEADRILLAAAIDGNEAVRAWFERCLGVSFLPIVEPVSE